MESSATDKSESLLEKAGTLLAFGKEALTKT